MIVDVHTHTPTHVDEVPPEEVKTYSAWRKGPPVRTTNSWQDYRRALEAADVSIVFNIDVPDPAHDVGAPGKSNRINDDTIDFVRSDPCRVGFMSVHPHRPDLVDEVDRCVELGLVGIKLGANYQRFDPLGEEAFALYSIAEDRGLPILFHQGASPVHQAPLRYAYPLVTDEVAIRHPDLRIVMAHLGHPWTRETVVTVRKHPNVYADVSALYFRPWTMYEGLTMANEWGVLHKLLLGSDFPVSNPAEACASLRAANDILEGTRLPRIPEEAIEQIIHADALTALGLKDPRAVRSKPGGPTSDVQ